MALKTVLVEVEDSEVSDTHVIGGEDVAVIVIDWDKIDADPEEAKALLEEMGDLPAPANEVTDPIVARLKAIIADFAEEEEEINDDIEDDEDEDEDDEEEYCDECGEPGCEGECMDDDEEPDANP